MKIPINLVVLEKPTNKIDRQCLDAQNFIQNSHVHVYREEERERRDTQSFGVYINKPPE